MTAARRGAGLTLLLACAWLAFTAWARPLMLPDEGRYIGVAWEMLHSGDWLTPTLDGLPFFHKPPLFYWITAASLHVFGLHEGAGRAASVVGACLAACSLFLFARRWAGEAAAKASLWVLVTMPLFFCAAQYANLDMLVAGCISATVLLFAHAVLAAERGLPHRAALAAAYFAAALGLLAKGLIGGVLPVLVAVIWLIAMRRPRALLMLVWPPGLLLFAVVAAPWFVAMQLRFPEFLDYFFVVQHFKRFAEGGFNNARPFWFYPVVLALLCLPWFVWIVRAGRGAFWRDAERGPVRWLMLIWLVVVLGFFSMPKSKLVGYVLPAVPPLAFLIAEGLGQLDWPTLRRRRAWVASFAVAAAIGLGAVVTLSIGFDRSNQHLARALSARMAAAEPLVFIDEYFYDVAFYARLTKPTQVVEKWSDPAVAQRDNWRKELFDAGRFDRPAAAATLISEAVFLGALCRTPVTWVMAPAGVSKRLPVLDAAEAVASSRQATLWRIDTSSAAVKAALACP